MNKRLLIRLSAMIVFALLANLPTIGQSLQHPVIWTTPSEKTDVLAKINSYSWASQIITKAKSAIDSRVNTHLSNPATILNTIPALSTIDNLIESEATAANAAHSKVLNYASYAAMVYYVTGEEKYGQFAADILWYYIEQVASRTPETTAFSGSHFYDPRSGYPNFAIAYDFMVNYLKKPETRLYQKSTGNKVTFDNVKAQKAVHNIAMNALNEHSGRDSKYDEMVSNHPVLRAPGVLFSLLCVEDDTERERMFNIFWNVGTRQQNSFTKTILPMFGEQGIWPESVSYGFMPNITLILNVVDRIKPELNVMNDYMNILNGNFLFDNLRLPNRRFVCYGDSHRDSDGTDEIYWYTMNIARRKGFAEHEQKATVALRQAYDSEGGYNPTTPISTYDNYSAYAQLFWAYDIPSVVEGKIDFQKPTVIIKHAGVALQRNYVENNNEEYGLCGIIGGAHYVHAHCAGISMELYGSGYVMGANGGLPKTLAARSLPEHVEYFMRHAGNNTVIVNGTSHGIQQGWGANMHLYQNTTVNVAAEPKHLEDPISPNFSFATQFLDDNVNVCDQQRTLSTIRTSATTAYYFDMFRSKSLQTNEFHDYVYHNLGDEMHLYDSNNQELSVTPTTRYQNDIGDLRKSPGWIHYENTKVTAPTNGAVKVRFDIKYNNRYMHMFVPNGVNREYTTAESFPTRESLNGYINKKTKIVAIRQQGEAWDKPYISIFEPSAHTQSAIQSVENIETNGKIVGAKVTSLVGGKEIVDVIISLDKEETVELPQHFISFTGRFAIVRTEKLTENTQNITLYIGHGDKLKFRGEELIADAGKKGVKTLNDVNLIDKTTPFNLTVNVLGTGGTVTLSPQKETYTAGESITITAHPEEGFVLDEWSGNSNLTSGSENTYVVTLFADETVTASFRYAENFSIDVTSEFGEVTKSVEGARFYERSHVELTAVADYNHDFIGWSGDIESLENPISLRVDSNINVVANYREVPMFTLDVSTLGNGAVSISPLRDAYRIGSSVSLTANAAEGESFVKWTGDYATIFPNINITMNKDYAITANFTELTTIDNTPLSSTKAFPNPSSGTMRITTDYDGACNYTINDVAGKTIQEGILYGSTFISIENSGVYFIKLKTQNYNKTIKIIVR